MAAHGIDLGGEGSRGKNGCAAPRRHRQQVRVVGHDEHGSDFGGKVQDQVVLMIGAIVHRAGHVGQQPSPAMLGCLRDDRHVAADLRACGNVQLGKDVRCAEPVLPVLNAIMLAIIDSMRW